jgi:plasmid stability protein
MEAEIRDILTTAVRESEPSADLFNTLLDRFTALRGLDLPVPARTTPASAADFPT